MYDYNRKLEERSPVGTIHPFMVRCLLFCNSRHFNRNRKWFIFFDTKNCQKFGSRALFRQIHDVLGKANVIPWHATRMDRHAVTMNKKSRGVGSET